MCRGRLAPGSLGRVRVVRAERPGVALEVAGAVLTAAVVLVGEAADDLRARRLRPVVMRVWVVDHDVERDRAPGRVDRRLALAALAQHHDPGTQPKLGVLDRPGVVAVDRLLLESERLLEPVDRGAGVAVAKRWENVWASVHAHGRPFGCRITSGCLYPFPGCPHRPTPARSASASSARGSAISRASR